MQFRAIMAAVLALLMLAMPALAMEAENIAGKCAFQVSEGDAYEIYDASINTGWTPDGANPEMMMRLPDSGAKWFQINWTVAATDFEISQYDAGQNLLSTVTESQQDTGFLANLYEIAPGAKYVSVKFSQPKQGINKIRVFGEGDLPATVVKWNPPHEKCDLMVISTHMDDEWLWFGGIIPLYDTVQGKDVQVVYMTDCGRLRRAEALNALAVAGVRTYPVFLEFKDERIDSLNKTLDHWGGKEGLMQVMVALLRCYKPEVILTHDWDGEYGHNQHILTSRCMETVIEAAADASQYPESAEKYGAWQVKKLYRHLEKKSPIQFDWHVSYPELGGRTLLQTADDAMQENASQIKYYQVEDHGEYDNSLFGLSYSVVGDDAEHKDLFENVVLPTPTPEPTPLPTPAPTALPTPEPTPEPEPGMGAMGIIGIVLGALALAGAGVAAVVILKKRAEEKRRRERLRRLAAIRRARAAREGRNSDPKA